MVWIRLESLEIAKPVITTVEPRRVKIWASGDEHIWIVTSSYIDSGVEPDLIDLALSLLNKFWHIRMYAVGNPFKYM